MSFSKNSIKILLVVSLLISSSAISAMDLLALPFNFTKREQPTKDKRKGVMLFVVPSKTADQFKFFANGKQVAQTKVSFDYSDYEDLPKDTIKSYKSQLGAKSNSDFIEKIKSFPEILKMFSIYDDKLCALLGFKFLHYNLQFKDGKKILYTVKAYYQGKPVASAKAKSISWGSIPKIDVPQGIKAKPFDKSAMISWKALKTDGVISYSIYYSLHRDKGYVKANKKMITVFGGKTSNKQSLQNMARKSPKVLEGKFGIKNLINKKKYFVKMASVHFNRMESKFSKPIMVIPNENFVPPPPILNRIPKSKMIAVAKISWQKSSYKGTAYYNLFRATSMAGPFKKINKIAIPKSVTDYDDKGPFDYSKTYWYRVAAVSQKGNQSPTSAAVYYQPLKKIPPSRVSIKKISSFPDALKIEFRLVKNQRIFQYFIFRSTSSTGVYSKIANVKPNTNWYLDKKLDARLSYCYKVNAQDRSQNISPDTKPKCAVPKNGKSLSPVGGFNVYKDQGGVVIRWTYQPHNLLAGFIVYRSTNSQTRFKKIKQQILPDNARMYIDRKLKPGNTYYYYVKTVALNNVTGVRSKISSIKIKYKRPRAIQNLRLYQTRNKKQLIIKWDYFNKYDTFIIQAMNVKTKKILKLGNAITKEFRWSFPYLPSKGRYEITVKVKNNNLLSNILERKRITF